GGVRAAAGPGPARGARGTGAADGGGALLDPSRRAPVRGLPPGGRVRLRAPDVAISHRLRPPPYGGSNQFLLALRGELERRGLRVSDGPIPRRARSVLLHAYLLKGRPPRGRRVVQPAQGRRGLRPPRPDDRPRSLRAHVRRACVGAGGGRADARAAAVTRARRGAPPTGCLRHREPERPVLECPPRGACVRVAGR